MSAPLNGPSWPRDAARCCQHGALLDALENLLRGDRDMQAALVTLLRHGDEGILRAVYVIVGCALRVARRGARRGSRPITAPPGR